MPIQQAVMRGRTGLTTRGHTAYMRVERIGKVSIYKRGDTYSLYSRPQARRTHARVGSA